MRYLSLLFVALAAICKAVSDVVYHHVGRSIFKDLDPNFWNPDVSWKTAKTIFAYKLDAWHLFNSGMIFFFMLAVVFYVIGTFEKVLLLILPAPTGGSSTKGKWTVFWSKDDIVYRRWPHWAYYTLVRLVDFTILSLVFILVFNTFYNKVFIN